MDAFNDDNALVVAAMEVAEAENAGTPVPQSVKSLLRAIASTRDEQRRHEMASSAEALAGNLGAVALQVLRVGIFALA